MHGQPSGLEMIAALDADHVLRRNIPVSTQSKEHAPARFVQSLFGSHHLRLQDSIAQLWNSILGQLPTHEVTGLDRLPVLQNVVSNETFGLIPSDHAASFGGLYLKDEPVDDLTLLDDLPHDSDMQEAVLWNLNIDPYLAHVPAQYIPSKTEAATAADADALSNVPAASKPDAPSLPTDRAAAQEPSPRDSSPELEITGEKQREKQKTVDKSEDTGHECDDPNKKRRTITAKGTESVSQFLWNQIKGAYMWVCTGNAWYPNAPILCDAHETSVR